MIKCNLVVLIDDSDLDTYVNKSLIEKLDLASDLKIFKNGLEAINYLKIITELDKCPDLVFLDLDMPIMSGFEFLRQFNILKRSDKKKTKIIVLTSSGNPTDYTTARTLGADAYLEKPLTKEKMKEVYDIVFTVDQTE